MLTNGNNTDRTRIVINEEASTQYEMDKDATKFFTTEAAMPLLYSKADGISYAINERPLGDGIVNLCVTNGNGAYCNITLADDLTDYDVTLEDKEAGKLTPLKDGKGYSFYTNGQTSFRLYRTYILPEIGREAICLPSTSPANAAWSFDRLLSAWSAILDRST